MIFCYNYLYLSHSWTALEFIFEFLCLHLFADIPQYFLSEFFFLGVLTHDGIHQVVTSQFLYEEVEWEVSAC